MVADWSTKLKPFACADPEVCVGGGVKLCQAQPGLKLDLLWYDSLRKLSGSMHVLVWTTCLHLCSKFVELL